MVRLWHLPSSHFSEKARWALDFKQIPHVRRTPLAAPHFAVAAVLTRREGRTFPVLELDDGRVLGDSTAILEGLERAFPDPPLYPADPELRARTVELEDRFDATIGEAVRTFALHHVAHDPPALRDLSARHIPFYMEPAPGLWARQFGAFIRQRYGLDEPGAAERAAETYLATFDLLEAELGDGDHLVGDTFTAADLTAASHFYWPIQPPEGPRIVERLPPALAEIMAPHRERRGYRWVLEMYARHRGARRRSGALQPMSV